MHKPHHTPHAILAAGEADEPLTCLVKASSAGWTATATWAGYTAEGTALGPCEAAKIAREALLSRLRAER